MAILPSFQGEYRCLFAASLKMHTNAAFYATGNHHRIVYQFLTRHCCWPVKLCGDYQRFGLKKPNSPLSIESQGLVLSVELTAYSPLSS